jgi:hypothetical protein
MALGKGRRLKGRRSNGSNHPDEVMVCLALHDGISSAVLTPIIPLLLLYLEQPRCNRISNSTIHFKHCKPHRYTHEYRVMPTTIIPPPNL